MERSFTELRKILFWRTVWTRCSVMLSAGMIATACYLFWNHHEECRRAQERIDAYAFGPIGKIVDIYPSKNIWDHVFNTPIEVTLENEEGRRVRVQILNWIRPRMRDVWEVRIIDPDRKGRCRLCLQQPIRSYPWGQKHADPSRETNLAGP